ncbi:MAG: efflux RND transporter permease subunit [Oligoflexia bacterium]|nr:efflux RND transporter permease subunit [Oligoflexia bacterium]
MKSAVSFFVENYKLTLILSLFLMLYGFMGLSNMNAEKFPAVSLATATIVTTYGGASADDIETKITKPIEDEIKGVVGIKDVSSVSMSGLSSITVRVDMDNYNVTEVMDEIQKKVDGTPGLPIDLEDKPNFTEINSEEMPVFEIAVLGPNDKRQRDKVAEDIQELLEDIEEVKQVTLKGNADREFNIKLDVKRMDQNYISVSEVINKIATRNVNVPGGKLKKEKDEALLRVEGKIKNVDDLKNFMIRSNFEGSEVLLKDISTVIDGEEERRIKTLYNGKPATIVTVVKKGGQDVIKLVSQIKERLASFEKEKSEDKVTLNIILDESIEVQNKVDVLASNAVTGLVLVIIFLFIFLPWKIGVAASISLPLATMATFGIMPYFGLNLDSITILALIISIGMLVDNSVVISETYTRYLNDGLKPKEAAKRSVTELWGPITASAFTTIAAFLPMMATKGVMGAFITSIPIVVTASLLFSLAESFFLLPMRLTTIAKKVKIEDQEKVGFYKKFEIYFGKFIGWCVRNRYLGALGFVAVFGISLFFLTVMNKFILFPAEETEVYIARFESPSGTTLDHTDKLATQLSNEVIKKLGDKLDYVLSTVGEQRNSADDPKGGDGDTFGLLKINVNDETKFNVPYTEILQELREIKAPYLHKLSFEELINGPPVGSAIEAKFRSNNAERLNQMIQLVLSDMKKTDGITDLKIDDVIGEDEIFVNIDFRQADRVGLNTQQIGDTIRAAVSGSIISQVTLANKDVDLKVRFEKNYRKDINSLLNLKILNNQGKLVRLGKVASFKRKQGTPQIKRFKNKRARTITGNVNVDVITSDKANNILLKSFEKHRDTVKGVSLYQGGAAESTAESMESLANAGLIAMVGIFALLVFIFNSFLKPFIILTTIPLGLFGFAISFYLHDRPVSFLALIGVIGLAGIIVNSGIVLISYIDQLLKEGSKDINEILVDAAVTRFRPVLVTSLTTISGLFPTAYAVGGSDSMLIPMTMAMAWGLTTGTIMTLIWIPCAYGILMDILSFFSRLFHKTETA